MIKTLILLTFLTTNLNFVKPSNTKIILEEPKNTFVKPSTLEELRNADPLDIASLDSYDSRDYDIVTPIKKQFLNNCWAFATMAASETSILREGLFYSDLRNLDLSELNHTYRVFNNDPSLDPLNLTKGDNYRGNYDRGYHLYGSGQRMLTWNSPSHEAYDERFPSFGEADFLLEDIIRVDHKNIDDIKRNIARYGALTVTYQITDYMEDYYYYNGNINLLNGDLHAVTIVGWDDTVDKNLYKMPASLNGGLICKNSWGTSHAEGDGYFMMSYDTPIKEVYAFDFASKDKYDFNYHYDSFTTKEEYLENNEDSAVIFPVKKSSIDKQEFLKAINVSILDNDPYKRGGEGLIEAKIYKDVTANESDIYSSLNNPINPNGPVASISRKIDREGSFTLELPEEIELEKGSYFSVVIKVSDINNNYRVALSSEDTTSSNDLTFYKNNEGNWVNCGFPTMRHVARIKAFTKLKDRTESIENDLKYAEIEIDSNFKPRYNEVPNEIDVKVISGNKTLTKDIDYILEPTKIEVKSNLEDSTSDFDVVATGIIKAKGINEWKGEVTLNFPILVGMHDLSVMGEVIENNTLKMTVDGSCYTYKDIPLPNGWRFLYANDELKVGENSGNYIEYIANDSKCFRRSMYPVIVNKTSESLPRIDINLANISLKTKDFIFNFKEHTPEVNITYEGETLKINEHYFVSYKDNINAGEAKVIVNGIGKFNGSKEIPFIIKKEDINNTKITFDNEFSYTGNEIKPNINVYLDTYKLIENKDYKITYLDNINAGKGKIKIEGINNFSGIVENTFTINKAKNKILSFEIIDGEPKATSLFGEIEYIYYLDSSCLEVIDKPVNEGEYYVKAVVKETLNYEGAQSEALKYVIKIDKPVEPEIPDTPDTPETPEENKENVDVNVIIISVLTPVIIIILGLGIFLFIKNKKKH